MTLWNNKNARPVVVNGALTRYVVIPRTVLLADISTVDTSFQINGKTHHIPAPLARVEIKLGYDKKGENPRPFLQTAPYDCLRRNDGGIVTDKARAAFVADLEAHVLPLWSNPAFLTTAATVAALEAAEASENNARKFQELSNVAKARADQAEAEAVKLRDLATYAETVTMYDPMVLLEAISTASSDSTYQNAAAQVSSSYAENLTRTIPATYANGREEFRAASAVRQVL